MGLFGKKNGQAPPQGAETTNISPTSGTTAALSNIEVPNQKPFNLSDSVASAWSTFKQVGATIKNTKNTLQESEAYQTSKGYQESFYNQFCHPLGNLYRQFPNNLTLFKFDLISDYSQRDRLFALNGLALITAVLSLRAASGSQLLGRSLKTIKSTSIAYIFGGLLIAPEIYNPLIRNDF